MTDIQNFFLPQAQTLNTPTAQASAKNTKTEDGTPSQEANDFLDLLFSHFTTETEISATTKETGSNTSGLASKLFNNTELILLTPQNNEAGELNLETLGTDSEQLKLLNKLKDLLAGIPELNKQESSTLTDTENSLSGTLSVDMIDDFDLADIESLLAMQKELTDAGIPALIASNLSPQDLETITEEFSPEELEELGENAFAFIKILAVETPKANDTENELTLFTESLTETSTALSTNSEDTIDESLLAFAAELSNISTEQQKTTQFKNELSRKLQGAIQTENTALSENTEPTNTLAAKLNNMTIGEDGEMTLEDGESSLLLEGDISEYTPNTSSEENAINLSNKTESFKKSGESPNIQASSLITENFDAILEEQALEDEWLNGFDLENSTTALHSLSVNSKQTLISPLTYAANASQAHPASHTVAASLHKIASNGENKALTLELDPPELGRVEIKMEFGKDKSIKAQLIIEKPETYTMLQRDAHMLEKALTEAGIDISDGSLNFSLAGGESDFMGQEQQQSYNGGNANLGETSIENSEIEIIETTLGIEFDPNTGLPRVNMMA